MANSLVDAIDQIDLVPNTYKITQATWLDVNSSIKQNGKPDLLPEIHAINNSIRNLFSCPIGARGRIFQPTYGTFLYNLLHEPLDEETAYSLRASLIQSLEKWEPRIKIDYINTRVEPVYSLPGYRVFLVYYYVLTNERHSVTYLAQAVQPAITPPAPPAPVPPTSAPIGLFALGGYNQVTLTWNPLSDALSYNLYWSLTTGVTPSNGNRITGAVSPYVMGGLPQNTQYFFVVTGVNAGGEGPASNQVTATTKQNLVVNAATFPVVPLFPRMDSNTTNFVVSGYSTGFVPMVYTSPTGNTGSWTDRQPTGIGYSGTSINYLRTCGSFIVTGGYDGGFTFATFVSFDNGVTWTRPTNGLPNNPPSAGYWNECGWNGSVACMVGNRQPYSHGRDTVTSPDGNNWTWHQNALPVDVTWNWCQGVTSGAHAGRFIAFQVGSRDIAVSDDNGVTWSTISTALPSAFLSGACQPSSAYGNGILVLMPGDTTIGGTNIAAVSIDGGDTWSSVTMPNNRTWNKVAWNGFGFIAITNDSSGIFATSQDGVNWVEHVSPTSMGYMGTIDTNPTTRNFVILRNGYNNVDVGTYD